LFQDAMRRLNNGEPAADADLQRLSAEQRAAYGLALTTQQTALVSLKHSASKSAKSSSGSRKFHSASSLPSSSSHPSEQSFSTPEASTTTGTTAIHRSSSWKTRLPTVTFSTSSSSRSG
jgi:hypothetical protein